ncbi:MAG: type III-A CRISPR-associated protein Csm2 [Deltaproteobacteria bacterium]|nr:MAG: type III-A CRISPR-associated protein Csm2 [Deltaproteobacteria bacterium]
MTKIDFWTNEEKRILNPKLFSETAENLAREISEVDSKKNKRTQLRKFYDEVLRLNSLAQGNPEDWDNILPYVNMLVAKAAYAQGRGLISKDFLKFIKHSIKQISEREDLEIFANFFEAFMGFYRVYRSS